MPPPEALRRNLRLFYAYRFMRYAQLWVPVWVIYLTVDQGFSLTQVTVADAFFFLSITLLEVPTGAVADRWGRRTSITLGALSFTVALAFFAFTQSYLVLLASFFAWAIAETLMSGADLALVFDTLKALGRDHEYEKHAGRGQAALIGGVAFATLVGGPVAAMTSAQLTVLIGVGTSLITAVLAFAMVEAPHRHLGGQARSYFHNLAEAFRFTLHNRAVRSVLLMAGVVSAGLGAQMYLVQPYLLSQGVEVGLTFSLLQLPVQVAGVAGALLAATMVRRAGASMVFPAFVVVGSAALFLIWGADSILAFSLIPVVALMEQAIWPVTTGYVNRRVPSGQRATILSMQSLVHGLCMAPLAPLVGVMADDRGIQAPYALLGLVVLLGGTVCLIPWLRADRKLRRQDAEAEAAATLAAGAVPGR